MIDRLRRVLESATFHRGLALGALVGAAIAGSTLWPKLREARDSRDRDATKGASATAR